MNKFKYYFVLLLAGVLIVSCNKKDDDEEVVPLRDYQEQYNTDNANIEEYLNTYFITVTEDPGKQTDQDVTFTKITDPSIQPSIMSYLNSETFPKLLKREVNLHGITYQMYYLILREGVGVSPMNTDGAFTSYKGEYLSRVAKTDTEPEHLATTFFEQVLFPTTSLDLYNTIMGWSEAYPQFKTGTSTMQADGSMKYENFGAGVLFIPSGLGYYGSGAGSIPSYSPLIFTIKLYDVTRLDHDLDGVFDFNEDINGDGYVYDFRNTTKYPTPPADQYADDTDKDGIPDFLDTDDDGDGYATFFEITKPTGTEFLGGISKYYPYNPVLDNPSTPNIDESEKYGIPRRPTGELTNPDLPESSANPRKFVEDDYLADGRKRIHIDNTYPYKKN